jgi:16S rRNA processing protein RimM
MELIAIGRISKPIGTRGEVKVVPLTDDTERFVNLRSVWVGRSASSACERSLISVRTDRSHVVVQVDEIRTVDEAEHLRDEYLFVPMENRIPLQKGKYFIDDVIGCEVVTEEQKNIGIVTDLLTLPIDDVWVVRNESHEILIPAVKEIIRQVDVEKKRIIIHALEGLLE